MKKQREPMYESDMCKSVGMFMSCNSCDRIIFEDENWTAEDYQDNAGYCRECAEGLRVTY